MEKTLAQSNPYIRTREANRRSVIRSCLESSVFEGARGLKIDHLQDDSATPRSSAATKKSRRRP